MTERGFRAIPIGGPIDDLAEMMVASMLATISEEDPSYIRTGIGDEEAAYSRRNAAIYQLLSWATNLGWACGFGFDAHPEWPVAYIDLPGHGQISWHLKGYPMPYDGHTTTEKYARIDAYLDGYDAAHPTEARD